MPKRIFFDSSWCCYRARFALGNKLSFKDEPTSVIYGFFDQIRSVCFDKRVASNNIGLFFDSRRSFRKEFFPAYKEKRNQKSEEELAERAVMHEQIDRLKTEILPDCGFPCYEQTGLESDDLMAQAALQSTETGGVIITADEDLLQCISDTVHWFNPASGMNGKYLDTSAMIHEKTVGPNDWCYVKCLSGCNSDCVPGVEIPKKTSESKQFHVGEKTAIDHVWKLLKPGAKLDAINSTKGKLTIARNLKLVKLPHKCTKELNLQEPAYQPGRFFEWCKKLGFYSFLSGPQHEAWKFFFEGTMSLDRHVPKKRVV